MVCVRLPNFYLCGGERWEDLFFDWLSLILFLQKPAWELGCKTWFKWKNGWNLAFVKSTRGWFWTWLGSLLLHLMWVFSLTVVQGSFLICSCKYLFLKILRRSRFPLRLHLEYRKKPKYYKNKWIGDFGTFLDKLNWNSPWLNLYNECLLLQPRICLRSGGWYWRFSCLPDVETGIIEENNFQ